MPQKKLKQYPSKDWTEDIFKELKESKLESTVTYLTMEIVMKERSHVLSREGMQLLVEIKKLIDDQRYVHFFSCYILALIVVAARDRRLILGMSRSTQELEDAYRAFSNLSSKCKQVLQKWHTEESRIKSDSTYVFQRAFQVLEVQALDVAMQAIENTLHEFPWREKGGVRLYTCLQSHMLMSLQQLEDLIFQNKYEIKAFLTSIQQEMRTLLAPIKRDFVTSVRQLANQSHAKIFDSLKATIQESIGDNEQNELIEDITDQLASRDHEIGSLPLSSINNKIVHTVFPKCHTNEGSSNNISNVDASDGARDVGHLGFMLRAPAAVLATISLLSTGLWSFIHRVRI